MYIYYYEGAVEDRLVSVIWNNGVSAIQGFYCIEVYGEMVGTFRNVVI